MAVLAAFVIDKLFAAGESDLSGGSPEIVDLIEEASDLADVGVETVRFYEREGLIEEPPRRVYGSVSECLILEAMEGPNTEDGR